MPDPFELDKDVEDFFAAAQNANNAPEVPPAPAPAAAAPEVPAAPATPAAPAAPVAAPAVPVEDPAITALRLQLGQLQNYSAQLERNMQQLQQTPPAPKVEAPDPDTDPLGHMMHELAETKKMLTQVTEHLSRQTAESQQTQELRGFVDNVQSMTNAFMTKQADYGQAYQYLRSVRTQDMKDLGVPPQQIPDLLLKEELAVAANALKQGINPAQMVYNIAQRYGYKAAPVPPPPAAKMAVLQQGQAAAPTPVDKAGAGVNLTLDSVKDMTNDQMDKLVESNDLWAKVVGGNPEGNSIFH